VQFTRLKIARSVDARRPPIRLLTCDYKYDYEKLGDTSIRVYVMADTDTDTSTPCVGVTVTYIIMPGRSGECSYFTQWVAHSIQGSTCRPLATQTCALSQFYDWLIRRNVSMTDSWDSCYHRLLVGGGVWRHLSLVASTAPLGVGVTGRLVSGYSLPSSNPLPYPGSYGAPARGGRPARRVTGANVLWSAV